MSNLQTFRPIRDLFKLSDEFDRLTWGLNRASSDAEVHFTQWTPAVDIVEDSEALKIHAELPGLENKDVTISVKEGVLTLRGERKLKEEQKKENYYRLERSYGLFTRAFTLPNTVDPEKIQATMKNGVLEIYLPKRPEAKPKEISIKVQ